MSETWQKKDAEFHYGFLCSSTVLGSGFLTSIPPAKAQVAGPGGVGSQLCSEGVHTCACVGGSDWSVEESGLGGLWLAHGQECASLFELWLSPGSYIC